MIIIIINFISLDSKTDGLVALNKIATINVKYFDVFTVPGLLFTTCNMFLLSNCLIDIYRGLRYSFVCIKICCSLNFDENIFFNQKLVNEARQVNLNANQKII